jgi:phage gp16-like protein
MSISRADLAKIHIAKKDLCLTDEVYRDILKSRFKKDSAAKLTSGQAFSLINYFQKLGWKPTRQQQLPGLSVPSDKQSRKILALWISLADAGVVKDRSDRAMMSFVKRQTGRDHLRWCDKADKNKVIEALKDWAGRAHVTLSQ